MSGYYNNTCRVEDLLVNAKPDFLERYITKFTGHKPGVSYPARFEPIDKSEFKCTYPEGGLDSKYPTSLNLAEARYRDFITSLVNGRNC